MKKTDEYEGQSVASTLKELGANRQIGLGTAEAQERLQQYGPNQIEEREESLMASYLPSLLGSNPLDD